MSESTYTIATYDFEENSWVPYERGLSLWSMKRMLKALRRSWASNVLLVQRDDVDFDLEPWDRDKVREWRRDAIDADLPKEIEEDQERPLFAGLEP